MRYYDIVITNPKTGALIQPKFMQGTGVPSTFTSFVNGQSINGLDVEMDFPVTTYDTPWFGSRLSIWGVGIAELAQSNNLSGMSIVVRGGMKPGLPLATAASQNNQAGVLLSGTIFQAFGYWVDNQMRLDLILMPPVGGGAQRVNLQLNCPANQPMSQALKQCIQAALPSTYTVNVALSGQFVFAYPQVGVYDKLSSLANWLKRVSKGQQFSGIKTLAGTPYSTNGVSVAVSGTTINVYDGTSDGYNNWSSSSPRQIAFQDMIGQPTFIDPVSINFKTVLRGDLGMGDYLQLPQQLAAPYVIIAPAAGTPGSPARNNSIFQGQGLVKGLHHFARFRQPDGASWVTSIDMVFVNPPISSTSPAAAGGTAP